jgi:chorismate dehydratase
MPSTQQRPRVCAVSYLNTVPLVWGAMNGPQKGNLEVSFAVPSICAVRVNEGVADAGILPVIEAARLGMETIPSIGIACRGAVRSILLFSKVPFDQVRSLAADTGSRTSVQLARIVLSRKFGSEPRVFAAAPNLTEMLRSADAALLIGDAALSVDPKKVTHRCLDLGEQWLELTGLPMVFALWAGRPGALTPELVDLLQGSCQFGLSDLDRIAAEESGQRGFTHKMVDEYLRRRIQYELNEEHHEGMRTYLAYARELGNPVVTGESILR